MKATPGLVAGLVLAGFVGACGAVDGSSAGSPEIGGAPTASVGVQPSGQASSTGTRPDAQTARVTLDLAGDDCSGTVDLAVGDDWSFEDPTRSRETLYYQLPEAGTTGLPVASVEVECSLEESFTGAEASAVTWGDLVGYAEYVAKTPGTTVGSTSFAGLPAISIARTRNGASARFVLAFTEGEAPARIVVTTLVFSVEDGGDDVQAELDRVLDTATALRLQPR